MPLYLLALVLLASVIGWRAALVVASVAAFVWAVRWWGRETR